MKKAMYAFSGDPITYGHIDIIKRAAATFDEIIVGIGTNPDKKYTFSLKERTAMAKRSLDGVDNVIVQPFKGLLVDYAYEQNIPIIVKGVRNSADFDYENILHQVGESQKLGIDTFILFARPELAHVSSSAVKSILMEQGFIHEYVPLYVKQCLEAKMLDQYILGITGEIGTGKTYIAQLLESAGKQHGITVYTIDLDALGHQILEELREPKYGEIREQLIECFGSKIKKQRGMISRKVLGQIIFNDATALRQFNEIMNRPILVRLKRELYGKSGLIILNAALLAEINMIHLCNNNVLLVKCDKQIQETRLLKRGLSKSQIQRRLDSQYSLNEKKKIISDLINKNRHGKIWIFDNPGKASESKIKNLFTSIIRTVKQI